MDQLEHLHQSINIISTAMKKAAAVDVGLKQYNVTITIKESVRAADEYAAVEHVIDKHAIDCEYTFQVEES